MEGSSTVLLLGNMLAELENGKIGGWQDFSTVDG